MSNTPRNAASFEAVLSRVSYRDWKFFVDQDAIGFFYLQVRFEDSDTTDPSASKQEWSGRKWRLSAHMTDSEIIATALKAVLTAEEHEARERFLYRGHAVFGPHLDVDLLWQISGPQHLDGRK